MGFNVTVVPKEKDPLTSKHRVFYHAGNNLFRFFTNGEFEAELSDFGVYGRTKYLRERLGAVENNPSFREVRITDITVEEI